VATTRRKKPDHKVLRRAGPKRPLREVELPAWHGWHYTEEHERVIRWAESTLVQPVGIGQGEAMKIAAFQRKLLKTIYDSLATFISISAGNGKTTLMAAIALERICRGDDYVEVDVLATKEQQAQRLVEAAVRMIESSPQLSDGEAQLFDVYRQNSMLEYRPTGSKMRAHPARLSAVQGLNFNLALIDEISEVPPELVTTMLARIGKRPEQRVVGFGTPGFGPDNMLEELRKRHLAGDLPPGVSFVEFSADPGCDIYDEQQWRKANPAIEAGFLIPDSLAMKAAVMPEHEFRAYHLGQPVESSGPWLPFGAWDNCIDALPPQDGAPVVLALWGNYNRQVAIAGATLDGALFFGWQAEKPSDIEVEQAIYAASEQWEILELCHKPHIRFNLMARLADEGLPVVAWPSDTKNDAESTAALWQAIAEGELAHDHDPTLAEQVAMLTAKVDGKGNPRLVESEAGVSAALAARAAWWRAKALAENQVAELTIY
jgi:phage terminase large subunit-like protein